MRADAHAEIRHALERAVGLALRDDRFARLAADAANRGQAEADRAIGDGELDPALIDVGRQNRDPHLAQRRDILVGLVDVVHVERHQRRHELVRIVRLQVGGRVGGQRVGGGVRAVESVRREGLDLLENRCGQRGVDAVLHRAVDKALALLLHHGLVLLAHRGAQDIGLLERVSGQRLRRAHHLFLVHDHAVGVAQHRLQQRMVVLDRLLAVLAIDEVLHHRLAVLDRVERPGTEQRDRRDHVLEAGRLELGEKPAHPGAFHLEHADGVAAREQPVGIGIVEPQPVQVGRVLAAGLIR